MKYVLEEIQPDSINVPERFREQYGDIEELANSINERGQLQPIIIDQDKILIDGHRRLLACKSLGRKVLALRRPSLDSADRKLDELVTNVHRKDFTWQEECTAIEEIHQDFQQKKRETIIGSSRGWSYRDTAKLIGKSVGHISDALKLAGWIRTSPEKFTNFENKKKAMDYVRNQEKLIELSNACGGPEGLEKILKTLRDEQTPEKETSATSSEGWIYILTNPSLEKDLLKVGKTTRTPQERVKEISAPTGVPTNYHVAFQKEVADCDLVEVIIGKELQRYKYNQNREFFKLPLKTAIEVVEIVSRYVEKMSGEIESTLQGSKAVV